MRNSNVSHSLVIANAQAVLPMLCELNLHAGDFAATPAKARQSAGSDLSTVANDHTSGAMLSGPNSSRRRWATLAIVANNAASR